ncbi:MAG TPA: hypothetical protein VND64_02400 [Pirellulales bacterium]|nr:hypothetical protein [Pirellulales bacterium]
MDDLDDLESLFSTFRSKARIVALVRRGKVLNWRSKVLNSRGKVLNWRAKSTGRVGHPSVAR